MVDVVVSSLCNLTAPILAPVQVTAAWFRHPCDLAHASIRATINMAVDMHNNRA